MTSLFRPAGTRRLWLLALSTALASATTTSAAELQAGVREKLERFRSGQAEDIAAAKKACADYAQWFVEERLTKSNLQAPGVAPGLSALINDLSRTLGPLPPPNSPNAATDYARFDNRRQFIDEFGKAMVAAVSPLLNGTGKPVIVRINAARAIAEVARAGYDGAAETCLNVLAKKDENEAVKFYALQGLKNLFAIVPTKPDEPPIPEKTVFQKDNTGALSPLEQRSILALIEYVFRKPASVAQEDVDGLLYVRREAVRALALVRVQQVRKDGNVVGQPALALLRVARGDGLNPPTNTAQGPDPRSVGERLEAVIGFCNLVPPRRDRDLNVDYAVYHIGRALEELAPLYKPDNKETSTPWKTKALLVRDALATWRTRAAEMKLEDYQRIQELYDVVNRDIIDAIESNGAAALPNAANLGQWLKADQPKSTTLFKNDPKSTIDRALN